MYKRISLSIFLLSICHLLWAQTIHYIDGRPSVKYRIACKDAGVVMFHGDGPDSCDTYGAREAILNQVGDTYYLYYDGAGKSGWLACLAVSKDLLHWEKKGPILTLGDTTQPDSKSASSPWVIQDGDTWHMFYLGTPNTTPAPDRIPSFPYLTLKARSSSIAGPWIKQYEVKPFPEKANSFYTATSSPGFIVKYKGSFYQFFSASTEDSSGIKRTLGLAETKNLDSSWKIQDQPLFPLTEQVENSSLYYDAKTKLWYLFTNHIGIDSDKLEYTDAIWVYWSNDLLHWNANNKAIVLDKSNCSWAHGAIGMPTVIRVGDQLAILYDGVPGDSKSHMGRNIGLAWISLPIIPK